ncbi:hypothetical protein Poli38472_011050 [Pythium oligandrum]|uniref:Uncharacterized protein n=1 Tax=Pythium oligandrum TaxID=41045 RepID=A0A8K1CRJ2_PYTOL|nr:hypothetical protein Poli38472_011050 [Pythium oligandrum]|eukprot:TMW67430.1 hypothetical protein Poli38472_011050 [Pythium oligandrum]
MMTGNKHKNGTICMFPGCEKPMRTQKFKNHFVKAHLREGEAYTIEHRRLYEVARAETFSDSESSSGRVLAISAAKYKPEGVATTRRTSLDVAKKTDDGQTSPQDVVEPLLPGLPTTAVAPVVTMPAAPSRPKRPASAMSPPDAANEQLAMDVPTATTVLTLVQRRFNELNDKMDQILLRQNELFYLFETHVRESAASSEEPAAKRVKETSSLETPPASTS